MAPHATLAAPREKSSGLEHAGEIHSRNRPEVQRLDHEENDEEQSREQG